MSLENKFNQLLSQSNLTINDIDEFISQTNNNHHFFMLSNIVKAEILFKSGDFTSSNTLLNNLLAMDDEYKQDILKVKLKIYHVLLNTEEIRKVLSELDNNSFEYLYYKLVLLHYDNKSLEAIELFNDRKLLYSKVPFNILYILSEHELNLHNYKSLEKHISRMYDLANIDNSVDLLLKTLCIDLKYKTTTNSELSQRIYSTILKQDKEYHLKNIEFLINKTLYQITFKQFDRDDLESIISTLKKYNRKNDISLILNKLINSNYASDKIYKIYIKELTDNISSLNTNLSNSTNKVIELTSKLNTYNESTNSLTNILNKVSNKDNKYRDTILNILRTLSLDTNFKEVVISHYNQDMLNITTHRFYDNKLYDYTTSTLPKNSLFREQFNSKQIKVINSISEASKYHSMIDHKLYTYKSLISYPILSDNTFYGTITYFSNLNVTNNNLKKIEFVNEMIKYIYFNNISTSYIYKDNQILNHILSNLGYKVYYVDQFSNVTIYNNELDLEFNTLSELNEQIDVKYRLDVISKRQLVLSKQLSQTTMYYMINGVSYKETVIKLHQPYSYEIVGIIEDISYNKDKLLLTDIYSTEYSKIYNSQKLRHELQTLHDIKDSKFTIICIHIPELSSYIQDNSLLREELSKNINLHFDTVYSYDNTNFVILLDITDKRIINKYVKTIERNIINNIFKSYISIYVHKKKQKEVKFYYEAIESTIDMCIQNNTKYQYYDPRFLLDRYKKEGM